MTRTYSSTPQEQSPSFRAKRGISLLLFSALVLFAVPSASAQVQRGTPPFGSFGGGPDIINLANLNVRLAIPVLHKPGRGQNFNYNILYDSSVWYPVTSGSTTTWQPDALWGWTGSIPRAAGYVTYQTTGPHTCRFFQETQWLTESYYLYTNWVYFDGLGTQHHMVGGIQDGGAADCGPSDTAMLTTNDGSGYKLSVPDETLYTVVGAVGLLTGQTFTDRNGNKINVDGSGHFYDTLSSTTPALTVASTGSPTTQTTYTYTAPSGASAVYTMKYTSYSIQSNFGCSNIVEYGANGTMTANLVTEIDLPDWNASTNPNSRYTFSYENTPGHSGFITGRLVSVTLPTGGTISYQYYAGGSGNITCADGSTAALSRATPDTGGQAWTYVRTPGSGAAYATTITDPQGNNTFVQFQGSYETQRDVYQGSIAPANLLETIKTCYNGNTTNCTTTAVSSPIRQRNVTDYYGSSSLQCQHNYFYNSVGGLSEQDDYDYGSGAPGALLRQTLITYASLPPNITAFRQTVTVKNGSGTIVSQTNNNYDETTPAATSGIAQHTSVTGSRGNLTSINYPVSGLTSHFTHYDTGSINTSQDINGATSTYNYNTASCQMAFPTSISEPLSMSQSFTWNCTGGVLTSLTDENSETTTIAYTDPYFWRPASTSFPDGGQTSLAYNSATSVTSTTKMNSSQNIVAAFLLDGLGRTSQTQLNSDPQGTDYSAMTYDALGRPYRVYNPTRCSPPTTNCSDPTWGYTATAYDALGRVTQVTLQDGSAATASFTNNTITATDPAGKTRQSTFDSLGRLTQVIEDPGTSPHLNYATSYSYDALGNLTNVTQNGGRQRTYAYDALSRLTGETNPESGTITYGYDASGHTGDLTSRVAPAPNQTGSATVTTTYSWDALHRLTQKSYSDGTTPTDYFNYDQSSVWGAPISNPVGRMTNMSTSGPTGAIFSYDPMGRITLYAQCTPSNCGTGSFNTNYMYDLAGDTTSASNGMGVTISYAYDSAGRPTTVASSLVDSQHPATLATVDSSLGYYPLGALRKMTFGNGLTQTAALNNGFQPCRVNVNSSGTALGTCADAIPSGNVQDFNYGFNSGSSDNGNVASWNATGQQAFVRTFSYDSLNRLATLNQSSGNATGCSSTFALSWTYDAWGNRTDQNVTGGTCNAFHATVNTQNQLSGSPYQYDAAGNMIHDASHAYSYDAESRLISVDGGSTATYTYDAEGRRARKTIGASNTDYIHDLSGNVVAEYGPGCGSSCWTVGYVYVGGSLLAQYFNGTTYFAHADHLRSTRLLTAMDKSVVLNTDFLPFGELNSWDSGYTTHKFTGDERDSETGLDHTQFRQYSSSLGRWMHPDPAGLAAVDPSNPQSWNRYSYVLNNPLRSTDPLGLFCVWDDGSFDDAEDPVTGSVTGCASEGGTWFDGSPSDWGLTSDWSPDANPGLAQEIQNMQNDLLAVQIDVWTPLLPGGNNGISIWDFFTVPWSGTVLFPLVPFGPVASAGAGPTVAYNPRTDTGCYGLAVGAMVPAGGRAAAVGPLTVGNLGNADNILTGGSVFAGAQSPNPAVGVQAMGNSSGLLAGATFGTMGAATGASVSKCQGGVGKKLLNWFVDSIL